MTDRSKTEPPDRLLAAGRSVYAKLARGEALTGDDQAGLEELLEQGLARYDERTGRPVLMDAYSTLRPQMEAGIRQVISDLQRLVQYPELAAELGMQCLGTGFWAHGRTEWLDDKAVINARIQQAVSGAREEILSAQPNGPRKKTTLTAASDRDTGAVNRGVRMRTLYLDSVRTDPVTAEHVRRLSAAGAEYRTLPGQFERAVIIDRRTAFIGNYLVEEAPPWAAWQVTDPAVIAMLARSFESSWMRAEVWHGEKRSLRALEGPSVVEMAAGVRTTARQRALLRLVASGMQRPRMAAEMGVSERTLDTMLTKLKEQFGCTSGTLQELAYKYALSPDRKVDDGSAEPAA